MTQRTYSIPEADLQHVLRHTAHLWPRLAGARLFITGGTGFFGTWLLESLIRANTEFGLSIKATVLSRDPVAYLSINPAIADSSFISWISGDVKSFRLPPTRFTHVIHAATEASAKLNTESPLAMFDTVVSGTRRVLDLAVASGVQSLLLISSGAVYGQQPPALDRIPETYLGAPDVNSVNSAYGEGKRAAEYLCSAYQRSHGLASKIARCFAFVGPGLPLDKHFAIGNFINDALNNQEIRVSGDGTPYRSYLHAADLCIWLWTILHDAPANRPYNVGSDHSVSIAELAQRISDHATSGKKAVRIANTPTGAPPERYIPDISRARKELGLDVRINLDDAISRTLASARPGPNERHRYEATQHG